MHNALFVDEILRALFDHCSPKPYLASQAGADLVALAATCKTFKEPALDALWAELRNPTALVRCLPEVCCSNVDSGVRTYRFKRRLKGSERDAVKRYTHRIRCLNMVLPGASSLDPKSLVDLYQLSLANPFFPNLSRLDFVVMDQTLPLIHHMASPKLRWLSIYSVTTDVTWSYETFFHSLGSNCPNIESIDISGAYGKFSSEFNYIGTQQIRCWNHLRTMIWPQVTLDVDTLVHLSQMHGLRVVSFTLRHASMKRIKCINKPLVFATLRDFRVKTDSITTASELFARMLLPAVTRMSVFFDTTPARHTVKSFALALARIPNVNLNTVTLMQLPALSAVEDVGPIALTFDDIRPLMASNLTQIDIQLDWIIELRESDVLEVASSCRRLSRLVINDISGWRSPGITPTGLAQIFQICPSLFRLCVAVDTRGYTLPLQQRMYDFSSFLSLRVDVVDSAIQAEAIPALVAFFADPIFGRSVYLSSWSSHHMCRHVPDSEVYRERWKEVERLAKQMVAEHHQDSGSISCS